MRVLGIDPGSHFTGYGVVEKGNNSRLVHVCHGRVRLSPDAPMPERLLKISEELALVIKEYRPEAVAVESLFYSKNVKSVIMLSHARGVALLSAASFALSVHEYAPKVIKQAVTGYGSAAKEQVQKMIKMLLGTSDLPATDAADALAIAICHLNHSRMETYARAALKASLAR